MKAITNKIKYYADYTKQIVLLYEYALKDWLKPKKTAGGEDDQ